MCPRVSTHRVEPGDRYLLCTDGLHLPAEVEEIRQALLRHPDPDRAAAELGRLTHRAGAPDNVVCVVADVLAA